MKTPISRFIGKIKTAVNDLQHYSYTEFQKLLPKYIQEHERLNYVILEQYFVSETGISLKDYFNQVKAEKASELFNHYRLSPIEVAYQLGFRTITALKKVVRFKNQHSNAHIQFSTIHRGSYNYPEYSR